MKNNTRSIATAVILIAIAGAALFAAVSIASQTVDSGNPLSVVSATFAFADGDGGGGDGGGGGGDGGGGDGDGGCCGGGDTGGTDTGTDTGGDTTPPPPPPPPPVICIAISSTPNTITRGQSSTLTWSSSGATSASISGIGSVSVNGSRTVSPTTNTIYTLTLSGPGGTVTCQTGVTVNAPAAPTCTLTASPTSFPAGGGNTTLSWTTTNATSVSINQGIGSVAQSGSQSAPVTTSKTFVLTATGPGGTVTCNAPVTVAPPTPAPVCTLTASPTSFPAGGGNTTLTWTTENATSATINLSVDANVSVPLDGSRSATVASSKTFVLTATGAGGTVTCRAPVTVAELPPLSCDSFTANPSSLPAGGGSTTLSWATTGATSVSINQGIGSVASDGSRSVNVPNSRTYTLTASNGTDTVTCNTSVTVAPPGLACDSFRADPSNLPEGGGDTTLIWRTTGATSVSINQGIGAKAVDGSAVVHTDRSRTYTLTASNGTDTVTCTTQVTVPRTPTPLSCDSFGASPSSFGRGGGTTVLTWGTTGATSVSIDQGVGDVSADGSRSVDVSSSRTFTLTASNGTDTVTCHTSVSVQTGGGGGGSPSPRCEEFDISDEHIRSGDAVTLSWETSRGDRIEIDHGVLDTRNDDLVDEGEIVVRPTRDTEYELTVYRGSRKDTCEVEVDVDDIEVVTVRDQQPVTSVSFREIPYTGFDAGPMLTSLFYTLLALWSAAVAYILFVKREPVLGFALPTKSYAAPAVAPAAREEHVVASVAAPAHGTSFAPSMVTSADTDELMSRLENRAYSHNILLSNDAMRLIIEAGETTEGAIALLDAALARAQAAYPREHGWIALDRARIMALFPNA